MPTSEPIIKWDGTTAFDGGVDSIKVTTIASPSNPGGLQRNQTAWMVNCTCRDGGITPRNGWNIQGVIADGSEMFQDAMIYEPLFGRPYILTWIGGHLLMIDPDFGFPVRDLSNEFGVFIPPGNTHPFMIQAEEFAITQPGDYGLVANPTLPVFWDGNVLRFSVGIISVNNVPGGPQPYNELPAASQMTYYQQRVWYAQGRTVAAGDIVGSQASGSVDPYNYRDSILKVTENPLALGGDGFTVPAQNGKITSLFYSANLDATLGQGNLFIGTTRAIYSLLVPVTRTDWIAASGSNQPLMTVVQLINGTVNDRSIVQVNGDVYFQSLEPSVRSLQQSLRYFGMPGNTQISANEVRILQFNNRALMPFATGCQFDNRLLECVLPKQLPQGVIHQAILPLDFVPVSSFGRPLAPVWEGHYEGLQILKIISGDFGGLERCFAIVVSALNSAIELWEITNDERFDNQDPNQNGKRVTWQVEFPSFNWGKPFDQKKLTAARLWIDKLYGDVDFTLEYRPDGDVCYYPWHKWKECSPKTSCDPLIAAMNQVCYPLTTYRESFRSTMGIPKPPEQCDQVSGRPSNIAYQIQPRLTVTGWCRLRGILLGAEDWMEETYGSLRC